MPSFSSYQDNYFISGIPTNKAITKNNSDIKYQISFKQLVTRATLPLNNYLFQTYLEVIIARQNSLNSQLKLIDARFNQLTSIVELYRALGGGWK